MQLRANLAIRNPGRLLASAWTGKPSRSRGYDGPVERVLFLGFEGVLHQAVIEAELPWVASVAGSGLFGWLPALVQALKPHPDVCVVVHSSWRHTHGDEEMRVLLDDLGERVLGSTPPGRHYESVQQWLRLHPSVTSYRILDSRAEEYPRPLPPELIVCDPARGVASDAVASALRRWLTS